MPEVVEKILNGNGVAEITLNRPEVYNVYNDVFLESLRAAYVNFGSNPDVRVILLRGNGKYFSAGADVEWFQKLSKSSRSIQLAAATATLKCMKAGGIYSIPNLNNVKKFLKKLKIKKIK